MMGGEPGTVFGLLDDAGRELVEHVRPLGQATPPSRQRRRQLVRVRSTTVQEQLVDFRKVGVLCVHQRGPAFRVHGFGIGIVP